MQANRVKRPYQELQHAMNVGSQCVRYVIGIMSPNYPELPDISEMLKAGMQANNKN
ncbi:MAG: hypothetical protein MPEBLZ_01959 [Candidatus Methanoperedens nitroreducens]|uniref:Uncharacterized protein n=1 Tax=Candidatus Methanoperedens nitratireducens TaxID=1392998 RepID=A0A0P8CKC3_9EURY|nr:MAG: hypothetical protein MPEBLZ_01959 [Candidatus Methanoperedens sp. BLZ1]